MKSFTRWLFSAREGMGRHESDVLAILLSVSAKSLNEMDRV